MRLKIKFSKYLKLARNHLNTPRKFIFFLKTIIWSGYIRLLFLYFPVGKITKFVALPKNRLNFDSGELLLYLNWLKRLKFLKTRGDCLPSSLVYYRFLLIVGEEPTLFIGFNENQGHAWVELSGKVISETLNRPSYFKPMFCLRSGESKFSSVK